MHENLLKKVVFPDYEVHVVSTGIAEVFLLATTEFPDEILATMCEGYKGAFSPNVFLNIHDGEKIQKAYDDITKTKLKTPLEMINTIWLLQNVSRSFTHQLVRTRLASYVQESMRFLGHKKVYRVIAHGSLATNEQALDLYVQSVAHSIETYEDLVDMGVPSEEARGTLPTDILTSIYVSFPFSTLQRVYDQRMCCQAQQGEWQPILKQMKKLLYKDISPYLSNLLTAPYERGEECGYAASFDRPCKWSKENKK